MALFGAIEAGGTKFLCAVGAGPEDVHERTRIPTTTPDETLAAVLKFFDSAASEYGALSSLGVACFGPIDGNASSKRFGHITETVKPGWSNTDVVGPLKERFGVPVSFDTDVNVAALGEAAWGAGQGLSDFVYVTVGTGIGGGAFVGGKLLRGLVHTEMGHMNVLRHPGDDFAGVCPFHGDCLEGLASGPAIEARWGCKAEDLPPDHEAWRLQSHYLARMCVNLTAILSPERIILGGGVMQGEGLIQHVRDDFTALFKDYLPTLKEAGGVETYIVPPALGDRSALYGAFTAAQDTILESS